MCGIMQTVAQLCPNHLHGWFFRLRGKLMEPDIKIYRWYLDDCTLGRLYCDDFQCFTLELPWLSNQPNISCIPSGEYDYEVGVSPKNGRVIHIREVKNRAHIQIHKGNFTSDIEGCILVGDGIKWLNGDKVPDVTNSKITLSELFVKAPQHGRISIY